MHAPVNMADPPAVSGPAANAALLRSLGRLARGLSALFWGLPFALIICVQTAKTEILRPFNILPPVVVTAWLCFGLWQLGSFQKQERLWRNTLDRAKLLAVANLGLSPFLFWSNMMPDQPFFSSVVTLMGLLALAFLSDLNLVLLRLSAMLPDENLRQETRHFTVLNRYLLTAIFLLGVALIVLVDFPSLTPSRPEGLFPLNPNSCWLIVFLVLLPLAMTMALIWKIKEVILDSVFGGGQ
jgi:hypothetical protein